MEEKKNGNISTLLGLIIICIFVGIISFLITNMVFNKLDNNSDNTDNNNTTDNNVINETSNNNVVTSDHITNDKVQAVYDQVKIENEVLEKIRYYEDGFFENQKNKINIILTVQKWETNKLTNEDINYFKNLNDIFYYAYGFIPSDKVIEKMYNIYNIKMAKSNFISVEKTNFDKDKFYGLWHEYGYSDKIDGFLYETWGAGTDEITHNEVYSYTENEDKAYVDTLLGVAKYNYDDNNPGYNMHNVFDLNKPIYEHIDLNTFKFSEKDKDKFTKIRYTFTKRDDGTYYVSDIKKIN